MHRITNGVAEIFNSKVNAINRRALCNRNIENLRNAINFYGGRLDLHTVIPNGPDYLTGKNTMFGRLYFIDK